MAKKKNRLTRVASYLYKHNYIDESCFEDEEITKDDMLGGVEEMAEKRKEKMHAIATEAAAITVIGAGIAATFMVACSALYYGTKGTAGLFKAIAGVIKR